MLDVDGEMERRSPRFAWEHFIKEAWKESLDFVEKEWT
jgi:hypothetical protein